ncbi:MAG: Sec-independent protein translocase protein TatC [Rhodothermaceae bacterium]|nr:MAG: Sec-independent protein translocase protein TatC [Rhodothermaceae bacterium]
MKRFGLRSAQKTPPGLQGDGAAPSVPPSPDEMAEMSFLDHLEELRWALIRGLGGVLVATIVAVFFREWIIENILLGPKKADFFMYRVFGIEAREFVLQNRTITGQFFADIGTIFAVGVVLGSPIFVYSLWKFVEPGLYPHEKQGMRFAAFFATFFFMFGIAFGYLVITPLALQFFASYQISPEIENEFDITKYFSMITFWSLGVGILFELPVVIYFLAKLGIATPAALRRFRKYALIVTLVLGAIFTPPDPISQVLVAMPLMLLYELSIYIAAVVERRQARALKAALE